MQIFHLRIANLNSIATRRLCLRILLWTIGHSPRHWRGHNAR